MFRYRISKAADNQKLIQSLLKSNNKKSTGPKKYKFDEAISQNNQTAYLLIVKAVKCGGLLELRDSPGKSVIIKGNLLKRLNEIVDEEIREVDQKIENL